MWKALSTFERTGVQSKRGRSTGAEEEEGVGVAGDGDKEKEKRKEKKMTWFVYLKRSRTFGVINVSNDIPIIFVSGIIAGDLPIVFPTFGADSG